MRETRERVGEELCVCATATVSQVDKCVENLRRERCKSRGFSEGEGWRGLRGGKEGGANEWDEARPR